MARRPGRSESWLVLDELRMVPRGLAALIVLGAAVVTVLVFSGLDALAGGGGSTKAPRAVPVRHGGQDLPSRGPQTSSPPAPNTGSSQAAPKPAVANLVGQRIMVGLRGTDPTSALLNDIRTGMVGGIILFPADGATVLAPGDVRTAVSRMQQVARQGSNRPLLIATDQEGGEVARLPGPPSVAPSEMKSPSEANQQGLATGHYLHRLGINVNLAPVLDLGLPDSFVQKRTFSSDPGFVAALGNEFASGLIAGGVAATAKHFPGLGHATADTDVERSVVQGQGQQDLVPFNQVIDGQSASHLLVMLSTAIYPNYDSQNAAAWSPQIIQGLLRHHLNFGGVTITDDLSSAGVASMLSTPQAAVAAAEAGADEILIGDPTQFQASYHALLRAAKDRQLSLASLKDADHRIQALKSAVASSRVP
jgi:beta-N-acetylhexosaminidase